MVPASGSAGHPRMSLGQRCPGFACGLQVSLFRNELWLIIIMLFNLSKVRETEDAYRIPSGQAIRAWEISMRIPRFLFLGRPSWQMLLLVEPISVWQQYSNSFFMIKTLLLKSGLNSG